MTDQEHGTHDHGKCIRAAIAQAEQLCAERGARLTVLRRRVLELVWNSHRPRGAYDILGDLADGGRSPAPLTVYRALDFLQTQGLVHRIESLNAFVGCSSPQLHHNGQFLVCSGCGTAVELMDERIERTIREAVTAEGYQITRQTVEIHGLCPACQATADDGSELEGAGGAS